MTGKLAEIDGERFGSISRQEVKKFITGIRYKINYNYI